MSEESSEESLRGEASVVDYAAFGLSGIGVFLLGATGAWWFYQALQDGLTYELLAQVGISLILLSMFLFIIQDARHNRQINLFGGPTDYDDRPFVDGVTVSDFEPQEESSENDE